MVVEVVEVVVVVFVEVEVVVVVLACVSMNEPHPEANEEVHEANPRNSCGPQFHVQYCIPAKRHASSEPNSVNPMS